MAHWKQHLWVWLLELCDTYFACRRVKLQSQGFPVKKNSSKQFWESYCQESGLDTLVIHHCCNARQRIFHMLRLLPCFVVFLLYCGEIFCLKNNNKHIPSLIGLHLALGTFLSSLRRLCSLLVANCNFAWSQAAFSGDTLENLSQMHTCSHLLMCSVDVYEGLCAHCNSVHYHSLEIFLMPTSMQKHTNGFHHRLRIKEKDAIWHLITADATNGVTWGLLDPGGLTTR